MTTATQTRARPPWENPIRRPSPKPQAGLDVSRLENPTVANGKTTYACPACREQGHDAKGDHLFLAADGKFGCVAHPGDHEHRRQIFSIVGTDQTPQERARPVAHTKTPPKPTAQSWASLEQAARACTPKGFAFVKSWTYTEGETPVGGVARFEHPREEKTFRQFNFTNGSWQLGGPDRRWPLLGCDSLAQTGPVVLVEGEKCLDVALELGLPAVCAAGGSGAAGKSNWKPLAGRQVWIMLDNDAPGEKFASSVKSILHSLDSKTQVRFVRLPELPTGGDVVDWAEARRSQSAGDLRDQISDLANSAPIAGPEMVNPPALAEVGEDIPKAEEETVTPYSTRAWDELGRMQLTPPMEIWGGWVLGALGVVFGMGGLGKSRLALNLARNQVLGIPFAGLPTAPCPMKHLFMGSENSIHRLQNDVRRMSAGLSPEQVATLDEHIRLATLEGPNDTFISMTPENAARWLATMEAWQPDVVWCDPWGDLLTGDANSDNDARDTISALRRILRKVNNEAAICILAHSRTGAANILQAVGYDSANFGKGSKALYSAARCVWNLAPGDESESPPLVMVHAKSNDSRKHEPIAVRLDDETMTYHVDEGFDFDAWQADLSAAARGKRGPKKGIELSEAQAVETLGATVGTSAEVRQALREKGANKDIAEDLVRRLVLDGRWEQWRPPTLHAPTYIGTPEAIRRKRTEVTESLQKKLTI